VRLSEGRRTLDELIAEARARIDRLTPAEAQAAVDEGGLIVDIRSADARGRDGIVPGSIHVPRTVLEWRLEPDGAWRNPHVAGVERRLVVLCDHGYSSIFAAAILVELGYARTGDVVGGFEAWVAAGLPVAPAPADHEAAELPGMGGPD
jgi:rhodanese-related sulfurtransferase